VRPRRGFLALPAAAAAAVVLSAGGAAAEPGVSAARACTLNDAGLEYNGQDASSSQ
jgi:hypothetical protein